MGAADIAQHDAALHRLDAAGVGRLQLRIVIMDGGAVDDQIRIAQIGRIMPDSNTDAERTLRLGVFGFLDIGTGDGEAAAVQDLDQRIGAGAASR